MILLDTNAVYWGLMGSDRLGRAALRRLESATARFVSSITHVEFLVKQMRGRLHLPDDLPAHLVAAGLDPLPYTELHAAGLSHFPTLVGHDPFDRMLLAQARVEGLEFLTADRRLLALDQPWIIDATL